MSEQGKIGISEWASCWFVNLLREWVHEGVGGWVSVWMSVWVGEGALGWISSQVSELSEWMSGWVHGMSEWVCECALECVCMCMWERVSEWLLGLQRIQREKESFLKNKKKCNRGGQ